MLVVGIGASAGGLRPLQDLFQQLPVDTGMAFVVVQHLSPDFDSVMNELLARATSMPIRIIGEGMALEKNVIYLNPPRVDLCVRDGRFVLTHFEPNALRLPINSLFQGLASQYGSNAVAVILSGTGSDGAEGLKSVHELGGLTIVQSLESAQFDGMPKSAIATGVVDYVVGPAACADLLAKHSVQRLSRPETSDGSADLSSLSGIQLIFSLLSREHGVDFEHYKPATVSRRIDRRLQMSRYRDLGDYAEIVKSDSNELNQLYHDLLIGVTQFFRDPEAFSILKEELHGLVANLATNQELRVWSAGCASGEEAYSVAMLLWEIFQDQSKAPQFKIFATDVHDRSLEIASRGVYDLDSIETLSPNRQKTFFSSIGDGKAKVIPSLRNHLVFAKHNVVNDPPFTRMDLVICRNLLIYLKDDAQVSALEGFRFALNTNGQMMLGPSETVGNLFDDFKVIDKHWRLFQKNAFAARSKRPIPKRDFLVRSRIRSSKVKSKQDGGSDTMNKMTDRLLSELLPSAVLLDQDRKILRVLGEANQILNNDPFLNNEFVQVQESVVERFSGMPKTLITSVIVQSFSRVGVAFKTQPIELPIGDSTRTVIASAKAYQDDADEPSFCVLRFEPLDDDQIQSDEPLPELTDIEKSLELELARTRAHLGTSIEELEASNEELQATNEEMIASNEELQATNEELQSVNEELQTVNIEYQRKVQQLEELTDDFDNLFNSTTIACILLDKELKIRKFTRAVLRYFNLLSHDIGRPLSNFASKITLEGFYQRIRDVMSTGEPISERTSSIDGADLVLDILPYTAANQINGAIINILDVSDVLPAKEARTDGLDTRSPSQGP